MKWIKAKRDVILTTFMFFLIFRLLINVIYFLLPLDILDPHYPLYEWQWYGIWFVIPAVVGFFLAYKFHNKITAHFGRSALIIVIVMYTSIGTSMYLLWNYPFKRPAVFSELLNAKQVLAINDFIYKPHDSISILNSKERILHSSECSDSYYYLLLERPLVAFYEANVPFNIQENISISTFIQILQRIWESNLLPKPASAYYNESAKTLTIRIIKFTINTKYYYHVSLRTGEIDNDHYALGEFLIDPLESFKVVKYQIFYYDFAGVEILDYMGLPFILETVLLFSLSVIMWVIYFLYKRGIAKLDL